MNRNFTILSMLAVFLLVAISFSATVSSDTTTETKESPLYKVRTRIAIGERVGNILEYINTNFLGERMFFLMFRPIQKIAGLEDLPLRYQLATCVKIPGITLATVCPI